MVRSSKRAEQLSALQGAELVHGDLNEAKSIADALEGMDRAFLLTNSSEQAEAQQVAFVDVAKRAEWNILSNYRSGRLTLIRPCGSYVTTRWLNGR